MRNFLKHSIEDIVNDSLEDVPTICDNAGCFVMSWGASDDTLKAIKLAVIESLFEGKEDNESIEIKRPMKEVSDGE